MAKKKKPAATTPDNSTPDETTPDTITTDGLVPMTKDGATLRVHPTCVHGHELVGWQVAH